jgi:hypothetical protein
MWISLAFSWITVDSNFSIATATIEPFHLGHAAKVGTGRAKIIAADRSIVSGSGSPGPGLPHYARRPPGCQKTETETRTTIRTRKAAILQRPSARLQSLATDPATCRRRR